MNTFSGYVDSRPQSYSFTTWEGGSLEPTSTFGLPSVEFVFEVGAQAEPPRVALSAESERLLRAGLQDQRDGRMRALEPEHFGDPADRE